MSNNRIQKLMHFLPDDDSALLITNETNVFYYSYVYKSEGYLLVTKREAYLLVDFRYYEKAKNDAVGCKVVEIKVMLDSVSEIIKNHNISNLHLDAENITVSNYNRFKNYFNNKGVALITNGILDAVISNQRLVKSESELNFIKEAQQITEKAYNEILNYIKPDIAEKSIAIELEYLLKKYGADDISFDLITISGKKTSLPHGVPDDNVIKENDFFTMDIGSIYKGYHSDMTRTVAVKGYTDEMKKIYDIVLNAQKSALSAVQSGIKASKVDFVARDIIGKAGYGKNFGHSTGHGVGLDIHETPTVSPKGEAILSENMVITIEPGIYLENQFGVRIEDMVVVKNKGYENFVSIPKELIVI